MRGTPLQRCAAVPPHHPQPAVQDSALCEGQVNSGEAALGKAPLLHGTGATQTPPYERLSPPATLTLEPRCRRRFLRNMLPTPFPASLSAFILFLVGHQGPR